VEVNVERQEPLMEITAAVYCRISRVRRKDGKEETLGVERQEPPCRELAARKGWTVQEPIFIDNDLSAYSGKRRPAYEEMLKAVRDGRMQAIIAWDADRLTRQPVENEAIIDLADRYGTQLATVRGEYDLATSSGRLHFRLKGAIARAESEQRSERLKLKYDQMAKAGEAKNAGVRAFGYERDGVTVREDEAALLREAGRRLVAGDSARAVIADWDRRGIRTVTGKPWSATSLRRALLSPRVAGLRQHRGEVVGDASWPAILDRDTWEKVKAIYGDPARKRGGHPYSYLLTGGLARCGKCGTTLDDGTVAADGAALIAWPSERRPGYACPDPRRGGCYGTFAYAEPLESHVADAVLTALAGPGLDRARRKGGGRDDEVRRLTAQRDADKAALDRAANAHFLEHTIEYGTYLRIRDELLARIQRAETELARRHGTEALVGLPSDPEKLRAEWDDDRRTSVDRRRAILRAVLDAVIVHPAGPTPKGRFGRVFDPDRVELCWKA
jgi:site-specific DNA recombinase